MLNFFKFPNLEYNMDNAHKPCLCGADRWPRNFWDLSDAGWGG